MTCPKHLLSLGSAHGACGNAWTFAHQIRKQGSLCVPSNLHSFVPRDVGHFFHKNKDHESLFYELFTSFTCLSTGVSLIFPVLDVP